MAYEVGEMRRKENEVNTYQIRECIPLFLTAVLCVCGQGMSSVPNEGGTLGPCHGIHCYVPCRMGYVGWGRRKGAGWGTGMGKQWWWWSVVTGDISIHHTHNSGQSFEFMKFWRSLHCHCFSEQTPARLCQTLGSQNGIFSVMQVL